MKTIHHMLLTLVSCLILGIGYSPLAGAATITVTNLSDSGDGSLRQAIVDAAPGDTINFGVTGTITLTSGELRIDKDLTIEGPGASELSISGNNSSRVFMMFGFGDVMVSISNLTIRDGKDLDGGGIQHWIGALVLTDIVVSNNEAERSGGGIFSISGALTITNSEIRDNKGSGIYLAVGSTLAISNSTISNNDAHRGGGIAADNSISVSVVNSTISNNKASLGGGIDSRGGTFTITNSTISGNEAYPVVGVVTTGGGIANFSTLNLINSTINGNTSVEDGGGLYNSDTVTLSNTIIANNPTGGDCFIPSGVITSLGYNLDSDGTCNLLQPTDMPSTDPLLGSLANNGGPTETHALLVGSPAIDSGEQNCTDGGGSPLITDQRGEPRPVDGNGDGFVACDIGAYEVQPAATIVVSIDILPKMEVNSINLNNKGSIQVAILSTSDFHAYNEVNPDSVEFGPIGAVPTRYKVKDVNRDGLPDMIFYFKLKETGIECGDTEATLIGETYNGYAFEGTDSIVTKGCGQ